MYGQQQELLDWNMKHISDENEYDYKVVHRAWLPFFLEVPLKINHSLLVGQASVVLNHALNKQQELVQFPGIPWNMNEWLNEWII